jgi:vacuolar-type H+-ATPase subunit I/STV1
MTENVEQSRANSVIDGEPQDEHNSGRTAKAISRVYNAKLETAVSEIRDLQRRQQQNELEIREYEENTKILEDEVSFLQSVQRQQDKHDGESFYSLIQEKDRSIQELKAKLKDRRFLGTFTKLLPGSRILLGEENGGTNIVEGFQNVYAECKQILYRYESTTTVIIPPLDQYNYLRLLVYRGLELDPQVPVKIEKTVIDLSKLSFQAVIRALTVSALREWVFETDFPI